MPGAPLEVCARVVVFVSVDVVDFWETQRITHKCFSDDSVNSHLPVFAVFAKGNK